MSIITKLTRWLKKKPKESSLKKTMISHSKSLKIPALSGDVDFSYIDALTQAASRGIMKDIDNQILKNIMSNSSTNANLHSVSSHVTNNLTNITGGTLYSDGSLYTDYSTIQSSSIGNTAYSVFHDEHGQVVGKLYWDNGEVRFEGDFDKSAEKFVNAVCQHIIERAKEHLSFRRKFENKYTHMYSVSG